MAGHEDSSAVPVEGAARIDVEVARPFESVAAVADGEAKLILTAKEVDIDALAAILGKYETPFHFRGPPALLEKGALFVVGDAEVPVLDSIDHQLGQADDGRLGVRAGVGEDGGQPARFLDGAEGEVSLVEQLQDLQAPPHAPLEVFRGGAIVGGGAHDAEQHLVVVRLGQVVVSASPDALKDFLPADESALEDDGENEEAVVGLDAPKKLEAIHPRHGPVEENEIEPVRMSVEHRPGIDAIARKFGLEAVAAQVRIEQRSISLIVFDDQNVGLLSHRGMGG